MNDKQLIKELTKHLTLAVEHITKLEVAVDEANANSFDCIDYNDYDELEALYTIKVARNVK